MKRLLVNVGMLFATLILLLLFLEAVCRFFFPDRNIRYLVDPELLAIYAPNQDAITYLGDGSVSPPVRINELGLRGPDLAATTQRRILFLGDSFTFGAGVGEADTFVSQVGRAFGDGISAVNGGQGGYGIYQVEGLFKRIGNSVKPELTILVVWEGMLLRQPIDPMERDRLLERSAKLKLIKSISVLGTHVYRRIERLMVRLGRQDLIVTVDPYRKTSESRADSFREAVSADGLRIGEMKKLADDLGSGFVIVFWPSKNYSQRADGGLSDEISARLARIAAESNIPFLSLGDGFAGSTQQELLIPGDGHPTPRAHAIAALEISRFVMKQRLLREN